MDEEIVVIWCHHQVKKEKIVTWKLISTSQYCKDKEILRTFRLTFTRIGKTWRRIVILEISYDVISIKHHVGYILPDVADYIDIRIPALVVQTTYSSSTSNVFFPRTPIILTT